MIKISSNSNDQVFEKLVQCFVTAGVSYSFFDNLKVHLGLSTIWKGWNRSYHRKKAVSIVKYKAMNYRDLFKAMILEAKTKIRSKSDSNFDQDSFKRIVNEGLLNVLKFTPLHISVESYDWKGNNGLSYSAVIFNFYSSNGRKDNFLIGFYGLKGKTKVDHQELLKRKVSEYGSNELWVNTCTGNTSNTLGSTSDLNRDDYPLFAGHIGCLAHIINLVSESMIKCIVNMEFVDDSELPIEEDDDKVENDNKRNSNITLSDILNDPFDGKSPQVIKKLIALNNEVRASDKKLKLFDAYASKRIPKYCSVRWNIKLNILKTFVENFTGFTQFSEACLAEGIVINNLVTNEEKLQGGILIDMLHPYELLTKYVSEDTTLAIAYVPILLSLRKHVEVCIRKAAVLNVNVCFDDTLAKIDKYIGNCLNNYDILFSASVLNLRWCTDIIDVYRTKKSEEFSYGDKFLKVAKLIVKSIGLSVNEGETPTIVNQQDDDSGYKRYKRFLGRSKSSSTTNTQVMASDITEYLSNQLDGALASLGTLYENFWLQLKKEIKLKITLKQGNWSAEPTTDGITDEEYVTNMFYGKSDIEQLILESKVWIRVYRNYIEDCRHRNNPDSLLPSIIEYLFSLQVTSVNTERMFSRMKALYGDHRHSLNDLPAEDEALMSSVTQNFEEEFVKDVSMEDCFASLSLHDN